MASIPLLITLDFTPEQIARLQAISDALVIRQVRTRKPEGVAAALDQYPDTEILYAVRVPNAWRSHWRVRWIQLHSAGVDHIPLDAIPPHVRITNASGIHAVCMAEHTFGMVLALRRRLTDMTFAKPWHAWPPDRWALYARPLLRGQTMGILGYGAIGREIGRLAQAFGMRVLAYKRTPTQRRDETFVLPGTGDPEGIIPAAWFGPGELFRILEESDIVVNTLPATPATEHLLDAEAFRCMRPDAIFVNIGRGRTVDETALVEALRNGIISGAALDVFEHEPLPAHHPFWSLDNVIVSPHVSAAFPEYDDFAVALFAENVRRYLDARPLLNEVDRHRGY
nr:D-2-hydroxyacid dehydrogenase [Ardenticatena sp.]